jgi:hypothetical protein
MMIKKTVPIGARRHGLRARPLVEERVTKTVLTFESGARVYHWTTDRPRARVVLKH